MRRKARGFTLIEIMVVIAIIAGLIGTVAIIVPQMQDRQKRLQCGQNLSQLGNLFIQERTEKPGRPRYDGSALWLSWRVSRDKIRLGDEAVLICPGDEAIMNPQTDEDRKKYDDIDLKNPPENMTSYAARDFSTYPLSNDSGEVQLIACDRNGPDGRTMHHKNGLNCYYDNGSTKFVTREELGFTADTPIVVGPDSPNDKLKQVVAIKRKAD